MTQFSLHLQFCDPSTQFPDKKTKHKNETMPCGKKDKVCQKCNYVHFVHCPIGEMMQGHRRIRRTQKINKMRNNMLNKRKLLTSPYSKASTRIQSDGKKFSIHDEIKMEGIQYILPPLPQTCIYVF